MLGYVIWYGYAELRRPDLIPTIMQDVSFRERKRLEIGQINPKEILFTSRDAADAVLKIIRIQILQALINLGSGKMSSLKLNLRN